MDKILKKAKIEPNPNIIAAATDARSASSKRTSNIIFGVILIIIGILFLFSTLAFISLIASQSFGGLSIFLLFMVVFLGLFGYGSIRIGMLLISSKSDWFLILYGDHLLYKYRNEDDSFTEIKIPLDYIEKCFILLKYREGPNGRGSMSYSYYISTHFQYLKDGEKQFISLYQMDGYAGIDETLRFLQDSKDVPVYYATGDQDVRGFPRDKTILKSADEIEFSGTIKDYHKGILY